MTLSGVTDGDIVFLHRQSSYAKQHSQGRPMKNYFLPSSSDRWPVLSSYYHMHALYILLFARYSLVARCCHDGCYHVQYLVVFALTLWSGRSLLQLVELT